MPFDAVVLDASNRQALVTARSLGRRGLRVAMIAAVCSVPTLDSRWCARGFVFAPREASQEYLAQFHDWLMNTGARVTIPSSDGTIALLRAHRAQLDGSTRIAIANDDALHVAINKERTLAIAQRLGVPVPRERVVSGVDEVDAAVRDVGLPAVIKPSESWVWHGETGGWVGPSLAVTGDEARRTIDRLAELGSRALVQEYVPGRRESVSLLYARGRVYAQFAQWAQRTNPPLGGASIVRQSIPMPPDIGGHATALVQEIGIDGYSEVEFRRDARGVAHLMEINARLSASVEVAVRSGVDFPYLLYQWATGDRIDEVKGYRTGIWMRYLGGDVETTIASLHLRGRPGIAPPARAILDFGLSFLRPMGYDYFNWDDPRPAITASRAYLLRIASRARRWVRRHR